MEHPGFFERAAPVRVADLAAKIGAQLGPNADPDALVRNVRPLAEAGRDDLSFIENRKYMPQLASTQALACLVAPAFAARVPVGTAALTMDSPYRGFALALQHFYPDAMRPKAAMAAHGDPPIHPSARLEEHVVVEPGAVIGREAQIGRGTRVAAGALVGYRVAIGRGSYIGPGASVMHALIGDRVILHAGVRIGQDGFGFAMSGKGHIKVPQIGRVIIQDDVEIGANSCVDRGALKDTIIGEGTKIDNLVQIGHNVIIGRHCVLVGQVGISGSTELGDFVVMGGQSGAVGHIKIGSGAQIAGTAHPTHDVPAGARMAGTPAVSFADFGRQIAYLKRAIRRAGSSDGA
jgi:UDP-3-O-[3-hydroxymyristoyl] glucosamine N-acyltransferase